MYFLLIKKHIISSLLSSLVSFKKKHLKVNLSNKPLKALIYSDIRTAGISCSSCFKILVKHNLKWLIAFIKWLLKQLLNTS